MPSRVGMKILLKDIEEGDILQIPYPGYSRCYNYFSIRENYLYTAQRKVRPIWSKNYYYTLDTLEHHWMYNKLGTIIGYLSV
jgi:hypothetical protein